MAAWAKNAFRKGHEERLLPENWGVQHTLDLQVDETGALNPGVSFITPMHAGITNFVGFPVVNTPQSYNLGLGETLSSQTTREDKFEYYWNVDKLKQPLRGDTCADPDGPLQKPRHGSSFLLESDLGIEQWLLDALASDLFYPSSPLSGKSDTSFKQDILSYHVKFLVISSGNVTPTWKLVRIATPIGSLPLASANRTRTHDLLITFGPSQKPGSPGTPPTTGGPSEPSLMASNSHLAQQIGLAVANSTRSLTSLGAVQ